MRVIFLDFDGVLHPAGGPAGTSLPFEWIGVLATLLDPFVDVRLVVHSSWREHLPAQELRDLLEPVADRLWGAVDTGPKAAAIERFLDEHPEIVDALVLDDQLDEFPAGFRAALLACEPRTGLSSQDVQRRLKGWLGGGGLGAPTAPPAQPGSHRVMAPAQRGQQRSSRCSVAAPPLAASSGVHQLIDVQLELTAEGMTSTIAGSVWNATALGARSDYGFTFEGRESQKEALLMQYPRWCEPVSGLVARCLALTSARGTDARSSTWERIEVRIALMSAARGYELLDTVSAERDPRGGLNLVRVAPHGEPLLLNGIKPRAGYGDPWDLADHVLRLTTFDADELPAPKAIDVPIRRHEDLSFICMRDIPEPARSVFEERMNHSTCPVVPGYFDAVYVWDWLEFLGGNR